MRILILGGTIFLGRHFVQAALARGHEVTLFHRGQRGADLFPGVEKLHGERDGDLAALRGRSWDAVVDTSGYTPWAVRASAEALAGSIGHYTFVSSISVYAHFRDPGMNESASVGKLSAEDLARARSLAAVGPIPAATYAEMYGPLKALCEREVEAALPGRALVVRPGLIVGPFDYSDRFTYWPSRVARGGEVLAPGRPERPVQFVDARDLASWMVALAETRRTGTYNATGPDRRLTMGELLEECVRLTGSGAQLAWVDGAALVAAGAKPWSELPLWLPEEANPEMAGFMRVDCRKAWSDGLAFRPIAETIRDTLAWDAARPAGEERRAGLSPEREAELFEACRAARTGAGGRADSGSAAAGQGSR